MEITCTRLSREGPLTSPSLSTQALSLSLSPAEPLSLAASLLVTSTTASWLDRVAHRHFT